MSDAQIVNVDVRKLGLGMSHAFQGMAEVCASLGVPKEDLLGPVDEAEKEETCTEPSSLKRKIDEQASKNRGRSSATHTQEVKENADQAERFDVDVAGDADGGGKTLERPTQPLPPLLMTLPGFYLQRCSRRRSRLLMQRRCWKSTERRVCPHWVRSTTTQCWRKRPACRNSHFLPGFQG